MKTVIVASTNPVKIEAARLGFERMFPDEAFSCEDVSVPSGVADQPTTDAETLQGARNRARHARELHPGADYWVGIEGGIEDLGSEMWAFAWIVILSAEMSGTSRTATFSLPRPVVKLVREGTELGEADDIVFNRSNSKQDTGSVGILTENAIDRTAYYAHAVTLALIPFKNPDLAF